MRGLLLFRLQVVGLWSEKPLTDHLRYSRYSHYSLTLFNWFCEWNVRNEIMGRKLTDEEYKQKLKETNPEYESLAPYQGNKIKIPHRHIKCGYIWDVKPNVLDQNTYGCPFCSGKVRKDITYFKDEVYKLVGDEYEVIGDYVNTHTKTTFRHNVCGYIFDMTPHNFISGQRCKYCQHRSYVKTTEEFKQELFDLIGEEYILEDEYINNHTKVNFRHKICGHIWNTTPSEILKGYRCVHCYGNKLLSQKV